jgi:hypothetical protein
MLKIINEGYNHDCEHYQAALSPDVYRGIAVRLRRYRRHRIRRRTGNICAATSGQIWGLEPA